MAHIQEQHVKYKREKHGAYTTAFMSVKILSVNCAIARITCRANREHLKTFPLFFLVTLEPRFE